MEAQSLNMADGIEKNDKSLAKHRRERFCNFLKLVEEISFSQHQGTKRESDEHVDETKQHPETKKRRLMPNSTNSEDNENLLERNEKLSISETRKPKYKEGSDNDGYVDSDSDLSTLECEQTYWLENEVVFIPASKRQTPLEFIVK